MKLVKSLLLFVGVLGLMVSCFEPPSASERPSILGIKDIYIYQRTNQDSMLVTVDFKDGNGDLGLPSDDSKFTSDPFNPYDFYLKNTQGTLIKVPTVMAYDDTHPILNFKSLPCGGCYMVTDTTHFILGTDDVYPKSPDFCGYQFGYVYIDTAYHRAFDAVDKSKIDTFNIHGNPVYGILDNFYFTVNPNYYNIDVEFYKKGPGDSQFNLVEWPCGGGFDGRFPVLSDVKAPIEGTLTYRMKGLGIVDFLTQGGSLSNVFIKLKIRIRDRALNVSNTIESSPKAISAMIK